jgi:flavin-binding protein dodecin
MANLTTDRGPATPSRAILRHMPGTYKIVELVGTSPVSFAEAVKAGVAEASKTIHHMDWFEVVEERGRIVNGAVQEFQVTIKVGFKIER